jgi:curved DNA-binding protein CbpA
MATSQRPGSITYYEELGVENTATQGQIREAYRVLVRLLHPDQQTDPQLRDAAELQMRKLNRIHAVLSDPVRRTSYDDSLEAVHPAPVIVVRSTDGELKKLIVRVGVIGGIVLGTFLLIWFMAMGNNSDARVQDARAASGAKSSDTADSDPGEQIARLRDQLRTAEAERDDAFAQLVRLGAKKQGASQESAKPESKATPVSTSDVMTEFPSSDSGSAPSASALSANSAPKTSATDFAGFWVFSKAGSASSGGKSEYPPEYIELTVTERKGWLQGQYHSRYQMLDHGVSPDVDFTFMGAPTNGALNCVWQGPGGAKGRMTMRLLPSSAVELAWNVTDLGSQQWLKTGTATLIRK